MLLHSFKQKIIIFMILFPTSLQEPLPTRKAIPRLQLQQIDIDIKNERNRSPIFHYRVINTAVSNEYSSIPKKSSIQQEHMDSKENCNVVLDVELTGFTPSAKSICLHQADFDGSLFEKDAKIGIFEREFEVKDFHRQLLPITGFVKHEPNSVVNGYLINKHFYGTIRLFDKVNMYTTHFYIEPIENAALYSFRFLTTKIDRPGNENAIIFEYVPHEDDTTLVKRLKVTEDDNLEDIIIDNAEPITSTDSSGNSGQITTEDDLNAIIIDQAAPITSSTEPGLSSHTTEDDLYSIILDNSVPITSTDSSGALSHTTEDALEQIILDHGQPITSTTESEQKTTEDELDAIIMGQGVPITSTEEGSRKQTTTEEDELYKMILENSGALSSTPASASTSTEDELNAIIIDNAFPITSTTEDALDKVIIDNAIPITSTTETGTPSTTEDSLNSIIVANAVPITSTTEKNDLDSTTEDKLDNIIVSNAVAFTSTTEIATTEDDLYKIIMEQSIPLTSTSTSSTTEDGLDKIIIENAISFTSTSTTEDGLDIIIVDNAFPISSTSTTEDSLDKVIVDNAQSISSTSTTEDSLDKVIVENAIPISSTSTTEDSLYKIIVDNAKPISSTSTTEDSLYKIIVDNAKAISSTSTTEDSLYKIIVDNAKAISSTSTTEDSLYKIIVDNAKAISSTSTTEDSLYKIILDNSQPISSTTEDLAKLDTNDETTTEDPLEKIIRENAVPITSSTEDGLKNIVSTTEDIFERIIMENSKAITSTTESSTEDALENIIVDNAIALTSTTSSNEDATTPTEDELNKIIMDLSEPISSTTEDTEDIWNKIIIDNSFPITSTEDSSLTTTEDVYPLKKVWTTVFPDQMWSSSEGVTANSLWTSTDKLAPGGLAFSSSTTEEVLTDPLLLSTTEKSKRRVLPASYLRLHSTKKPKNASDARRKGKVHHYHSTRRPWPKRPHRIRNGSRTYDDKKRDPSLPSLPMSTTDDSGEMGAWTTESTDLLSWSSTDSSSKIPKKAKNHKKYLHSTKKPKANAKTNYTKSKHHYHSTRVPRLRRKRAVDDHSGFHDTFLYGHDDNVGSKKFKAGSLNNMIFDMRRDSSFLCTLCIWVQPTFATRFAYNSDIAYGVAEILDVVKLVNWVFRAMDFNGDGLPENIGFVIKRILVADISFESISLGVSKDAYSDEIHAIQSNDALTLVSQSLQGTFKNCCAIFGFLYHNMAPAISTTTIRGLCTTRNIGIISGYLHNHKIGKYDLVRAMLHSLGHLFGSNHDQVVDFPCEDKELYSFINPYSMHPIEQINVGLRPDSLKMSICSKMSISRYLTSKGPSCLQNVKQNFCGNGVVEDGEECDCGSLWQCQKSSPCCGERGTALECKFLYKEQSKCRQGTEWLDPFWE